MSNYTIYKYPLVFNHEHKAIVNLPPESRILDVQIQGRLFMLWALVEADSDLKDSQARHFCLYGTGWPIDSVEISHIATVQDEDFVWHIFEEVV